MKQSSGVRFLSCVAVAMLISACSSSTPTPTSAPAGSAPMVSAPAASSPACSAQLTLRLQNLSTSASDWPAYIADKEGIFAKYCISVSYITLVSAPAAAVALQSGSFDAANVDLANMAPLLVQGQDFRLVVEDWTLDQVILAGKGVAAQPLSQVLPLPVGSAVGAPSAAGEGSKIWAALQKAYGGSVSDLKVVADQAGAGLISGAEKYGIVNPNTACALEQQGASPVLQFGVPGSVSQYPAAAQPLFGLHTNGYWATGAWVTANPKVVAGLQAALYEVVPWMKAHPTETAALLRASNFNLPTLSDSQFQDCVNAILPTFSAIFPDSGIPSWNAFLQQAGLTTADLPSATQWEAPGLPKS